MWFIFLLLMKYYSAIFLKRKSFVTIWMNLEGVIVSEISQKKKGKYHICYLICGI